MASPRKRGRGKRASDAHLDELIAEAIVDCYDESEAVTGLFTMLEESLALPFETTLLGVVVTVASIELVGGNRVAAMCVRGRKSQLLALEHLPMPTPPPEGAEWIAAWRRWLARQ